MLLELVVDLNDHHVTTRKYDGSDGFGKALAVTRIIQSSAPDETIYLTGYTPLSLAGLGFAGKLNVYGISLLGGNLQGSRSGGMISRYLTRLCIAGIEVVGHSSGKVVLVVDEEGRPALFPLSSYGEEFSGAYDFARAIYEKHGQNAAMAITDPTSTGFHYNAIACNARAKDMPHRVAGRSTTRFGLNGLVGVVVLRAKEPLYETGYDRKKVSALLRDLQKKKKNDNLVGCAESYNPLLGGTYGAAAKSRFDYGHGLSNLFRSAHVPKEHYESLLPDTIVREQVEIAARNDIKITRHSCMAGCPNRCSQVVILPDAGGGYKVWKAAEWETLQGVINLGIFEDAVQLATWVTHHSNDHGYDHIEGLVAVAALALASESGTDTGVYYGDKKSIMSAFEEAARGDTDKGVLLRKGAAVIEKYYGLDRHFTVGGHALPFHNGRSMVQTGVGLSWTYGRHGECCAGPGRQNFLGRPYDPADHSLPGETHVLNSMHGMILYGAVDELGLCFFIGPSLDTLVDCEMILEGLGLHQGPREMIRHSAQTIEKVHRFNAKNKITIQPLPDVFYNTPTRGNLQEDKEAVAFNVPFETVKDYGMRTLADVADGRVTVPDDVLSKSRARYS